MAIISVDGTIYRKRFRQPLLVLDPLGVNVKLRNSFFSHIRLASDVNDFDFAMKFLECFCFTVYVIFVTFYTIDLNV